jgi:hypothetical protein
MFDHLHQDYILIDLDGFLSLISLLPSFFLHTYSVISLSNWTFLNDCIAYITDIKN